MSYDIERRKEDVDGACVFQSRQYLLVLITVEYITENRDRVSTMCAQLTADDEGKDVVNPEGKKIGVVQTVQAGTAHVNPDPGLTDEVKSTLGWGDADENTYALDAHQIESITDTEIQVRQ